MVIEEALAQAIPNISDYLAQKTGLSKGRIKHALACGALRVKKHKGGWQRLRRATASLPAGTLLSLHYDEQLLALKPAQPILVDDVRDYSLWFKPPGLLSQGTEWGDHCSLLRQVELHFNNQRQVFLVHRLDRDACGLMLVAHTGAMADRLSRMFAGREMEKHYRVRVVGTVDEAPFVINQSLDGKDAVTRVQRLSVDGDTSLLDVVIETGRKHQIRRHLSALGHPVVGDSLYGEKAPQGLHLSALSLTFQCPVRGRKILVTADENEIHRYWR